MLIDTVEHEKENWRNTYLETWIFFFGAVLLKRFSREGTQLKKGLPSYIMLLQECHTY